MLYPFTHLTANNIEVIVTYQFSRTKRIINSQWAIIRNRFLVFNLVLNYFTCLGCFLFTSFSLLRVTLFYTRDSVSPESFFKILLIKGPTVSWELLNSFYEWLIERNKNHYFLCLEWDFFAFQVSPDWNEEALQLLEISTFTVSYKRVSYKTSVLTPPPFSAELSLQFLLLSHKYEYLYLNPSPLHPTVTLWLKWNIIFLRVLRRGNKFF